MSSLLAGYKFHILARYGLAGQVPAAKLAEMLWDVDTKTFRVGDDTPNPPRIMTEKSTGVFNFSNIDYAQFANLRLSPGGTIDNIKPSDLNKNPGFVYRKAPGEFENVQLNSPTNSVSIGPVQPNPNLPDTYTMSLDIHPDLLSLISDGFDLRNIPFVEVLPSILEAPLYRHQDTIYCWNSLEQKYEPIGIPIIRDLGNIPVIPGPPLYIDATIMSEFKLMLWVGDAYIHIGSETNVIVGEDPGDPPPGSFWYHNFVLKIFINNEWITIAFDSAVSGLNLTKRGVLLQWRYSDEGCAWEFWVADRDFNMRQLQEAQIASATANDDTITVENAYAFTEGNHYVLFDDDGAKAVIQVFSIVNATTIRAVDTLNVTVLGTAGGRIGSTSFRIDDDGTATVKGNQEYFSRPIRTLHSWPGGSFIIQRGTLSGSGLYTVRYREAGTDNWQVAELVRTYGVEFTAFTEEEYRIPIGNVSVEFWVSYKNTNPTHEDKVNHFALITQYQNFDSDRIEKPINESPSHQATNISVTPTLQGSTYRSLYGLDQIGAHFQISRDSSFYDMVLNTSSDKLVAWVSIAGQTGNWKAITMIQGGGTVHHGYYRDPQRKAVIVGDSGAARYTEDGGKTWANIDTSGSEHLLSVAWNRSDTLIAVGANGTAVYSSNMGTTWTNAASVDGFGGSINGVAANMAYAVAVGAGGKILSSINRGSIWSSVTAAGGYNGNFMDVAMNSIGRCIAVGANGAIHTSADYGITWSVRTAAAAYNGTFNAVTLTENGYAIAVGSDGAIQTSSDFGSSWTSRTPDESYNSSWMGVALHDTKAVVVGVNGEIQTSYNRGQTWTKRPAGSGSTQQFNAVAINDEPYGILVGAGDTIQHTYVLEGAGTSFTVPAGSDLLSINNLYWWRVRYQDSVGKWSSWSDSTAFATQSSFSFVGQPTNITPATDATGVINTPTLQSSNFTYGGSIPDTHVASKWQVSTNANFTNVVYDSGDVSDLLQHTVPGSHSLTNFTSYYWRVRHVGTNIGPGPWSKPTKFTVRALPNTPIITSPVDGATGISLTPTITTSSFVSLDPTASHISSQYRISTNIAFTEIVHNSGETTNRTSYTVPSGILNANTTYYVSARHKGTNNSWSGWAPAVQFRTMAVNISTPVVTVSSITGTTALLRTSAFSLTSGASDTHLNTDWEVRDANNVNGNIIWSSNANATNKIQITATGLSPGSTLFARARHRGTTYGNSSWSSFVSLQTPTITGQQVYTVPGTYVFTVPAGVFSISAVCIGAGGNGYAGSGAAAGAWGTNGTGGAGGGLRWRNNIPVTPGEAIPIVVGNSGQASSIQNRLQGNGGQHGVLNGAAIGGTGNLFGGTGGGGNGGDSHLADSRRTAGGGGAGGYTGNGATASYSGPPATPGGGGAGAGNHGLHSPSSWLSGGGGGVGLIKKGATGGNENRGATGGSGGENGISPMHDPAPRPSGGRCGGGGGSRNGQTFGLGGHGGVRIIWGPNRSYPDNSD